MVTSQGVTLHGVRMAVLPSPTVRYEITSIMIENSPTEQASIEKLFQKIKGSP